MDVEKMTNEQLIESENKIFNKWDKTGEVFSLSDFSEIIRELTLREEQ